VSIYQNSQLKRHLPAATDILPFDVVLADTYCLRILMVPSTESSMAELPSLDEYNGQTTDELIALEGKYDAYSIVWAFERALLQKSERVGDDKLTEEERVFLAVKALECEVQNGGCGQFFVNCSDTYAPMILRALRRIGCPKIARITEKAWNILQELPMTKEEIEEGTWEDNEDRQERLDECDQQYYKRPEDYDKSLLAFVKANRTKIKL
jgi:hypothetical protein